MKEKEKESAGIEFVKCKCCGLKSGMKFTAFDKINILGQSLSELIPFNDLCPLCIRPYMKGYMDSAQALFSPLLKSSTNTMKHMVRKEISMEKRLEELEE